MFNKLTAVVLPFLGMLVPKDKHKWVFSSWYGKKMDDNPAGLAEYAHKQVRVIWIVKNKALHCPTDDVFYFKSLKGCWHQLTAAVCVFSHGVGADFFKPFISRNTFRVQSWHGIPLKMIGYDDNTFNGDYRVNKEGLKGFFNNEHFDLLVSTGPECTRLFKTAFNTPEQKIVECGYPRNDRLVKATKAAEQNRVLLYMPTFRGGVGAAPDLLADAGFDFVQAERELSKVGYELWLKIHPANELPTASKKALLESQHIKIAPPMAVSELLNRTDVLVTDYSSVLFDFALTERPIILLPFDLASYQQQDRQFYFEYSKLDVGNVASDWSNIFQMLQGDLPHYDTKSFVMAFHRHRDAYSGKRLFSEIKERLESA